ncbi:MAG: serine hydrolase domain-containing protein [Saprospiraceae bacterium]
MIRIFMLLNLLNFNFCLAQTHDKLKLETKEKIDKKYISLLKKAKVAGASIAIVDNGEIVYSMGYGFSDKANGIKANDQTIYGIASCTKTFTALSIMQLHEQGKLDINNSVKEYLPEFTMTNRFDPQDRIFINDMLTHTSGIPSDVMNGIMGDQPTSPDWLIRELNKQSTISSRRYHQAYSNAAYAVLGETVAKVGETKSYPEYLRQNIFGPLKMTSSHIDYDPVLAKKYSKGYLKKKEYQQPVIRDKPAGGIRSNVLDMANFIQMLIDRGKFGDIQIISPTSIIEMETNRSSDNLLPVEGIAGYGYGLGIHNIFVVEGQDSTMARSIGHNGNELVFHANYKYIPELKVGVVILTNTDKGPRIYNGTSLLDLYLQEEKGITLEFDKRINDQELKKAALEEAVSFADYQGFYVVPGAIIKVDQEKKVKFKVEKTKIVLKKKKDANQYSFTAKLLGFIPIKIKDVKGNFVKFKDQIYFKVSENGQGQYMGIKINPTPISKKWKNGFGKYERTGEKFSCSTCKALTNFDNLKIKISEENGFVLLETLGKSIAANQRYYLNLLSENNAVTHGIGRNSGITVKILENGNIYFDGFEFMK